MEQEPLRFAPYARAIWRRKWLIVLTTVAAFAAGLGATYSSTAEDEPTTTFAASATVRIEEQAGTIGIDSIAALQLLSGIDNQPVQNHIEVIRSSAVMGRAVNRIREAAGFLPETDPQLLESAARELVRDVSISQVDRSNLIAITAFALDPDTARLRTESIVAAYQQFLSDQALAATEAAILAIDERIDESSQPVLTSTRLKIVIDRLSTSDLGRVERALNASISQLETLALPQPMEAPSVRGLLSELQAASARLQTVSIGLGSIEAEVDDESGSVGGLPGQGSIEAVSNIVEPALLIVQSVRDQYAQTSLAADLTAGVEDLENTDSTMSTVGLQLGSLSTNPGVPIVDRATVTRLRDQVLALQSSNLSIAVDLSNIVDSGQATSADRRRLLTQMNAAVSSLQITLTSLTQIRQVQTNSSALTQFVNAEGQLQAVIDALKDSASGISSSIDDTTSTELAQLENFLEEAVLRLTSLAPKLETPSGNGVLLIAEVEGVSALLNQAATASSSLGANSRLRSFPSSVDLLTIAPQLESGVSSLSSVSASLATGSDITSDVLLARVQDARESVNGGLEEIDAIRDSVIVLDLANADSAALASLEGASADLANLGGSIRSTGKVLDATAVAGLPLLLANRLDRFSKDLNAAADIFRDSSVLVAGVAADVESQSGVLIGAALQDLDAAESDLAIARTVIDELQEKGATGGLLTLLDADEVTARIQVVQSSLSQAILEVAKLPSAQPSLTTQNLQAAEARLRTVSTQFTEIESAEVTALDGLFEARSELERAVLQPQETGIALVDTDVAQIAARTSALPFDGLVLVAAFAGFILGIIGSLLLEFMDRTIRRPEDIGEIARVPSLGLVPEGLAKGNPHPPEVTDDPTSVFSEAMHLVTTRVQGKVNDRSRLLLVSSPRPREGKTMMSINLARALALRNRKVLLVDANFRKPDASTIFELADEPGLANALTQNQEPDQYINEVEDGFLSVLPAGQSLVPPVELISRPNMGALLERLRRQYDFIIIDGPPTLGFAESNALAKQAGAVVMVARAGVTRKASLREAIESLADTEVLGVVMNFVRPKALAYLEHREYSGRPGRSRWHLGWPDIFRFSRN